MAAISYVALLAGGTESSDGLLGFPRKFWVGFSAYGIALMMAMLGIIVVPLLFGNEGLLFYLEHIIIIDAIITLVVGFPIASRWLK